jgi:hypothetical protein
MGRGAVEAPSPSQTAYALDHPPYDVVATSLDSNSRAPSIDRQRPDLPPPPLCTTDRRWGGTRSDPAPNRRRHPEPSPITTGKRRGVGGAPPPPSLLAPRAAPGGQLRRRQGKAEKRGVRARVWGRPLRPAQG